MKLLAGCPHATSINYRKENCLPSQGNCFPNQRACLPYRTCAEARRNQLRATRRATSINNESQKPLASLISKFEKLDQRLNHLMKLDTNLIRVEITPLIREVRKELPGLINNHDKELIESHLRICTRC